MKLYLQSILSKIKWFFSKPKEPKEYLNSLDLISCWAWSKLQEENDVNWLRDGFDGRQKRIKDVRLDEIRKKLEDESFKLMNDDHFNEILHKRMLIYDYAEKYEIVKTILQRMWMGFGDNQMENRLVFIQKLAKLGFKIPELNNVMQDKADLERCFQQVEGIKTKIQLLIDEIKVEGSKITRSLNKEMIIVCEILGFNYHDPKTTSQSYWMELQKLAHEKNEKNKRTQIKE